MSSIYIYTDDNISDLDALLSVYNLIREGRKEQKRDGVNITTETTKTGIKKYIVWRRRKNDSTK